MPWPLPLVEYFPDNHIRILAPLFDYRLCLLIMTSSMQDKFLQINKNEVNKRAFVTEWRWRLSTLDPVLIYTIINIRDKHFTVQGDH